jgi:pimeloyl-ACP methyl ester carboxylesterase
MVLPGIMGSELVVSATGAPIWGISDLQWYVRAWTTGHSLDALRVNDDERSGRTGRITASRLLTSPAFAPILRGIEPYRRLTSRLREIAPVLEAVRSFPYDWRLPVAHNAAALADAADDHLRWWRSHRMGSRSARLVLVGHSMGGIFARYFVGLLGGDTQTRTVVTLGTPFRGSVKAAIMLNSGLGAPVPMPIRRLRQLVSDMPSMHDLLPTYRCVSEDEEARHLTTGDVAAIGGDRNLAEAAFDMHRRLAAARTCDVRAVVGINQPTAQSMTLQGGEVIPRRWSYLTGAADGPVRLVDRGGDGTVSRESATAGSGPLYLTQSHGALARMPEVIDHVRGVLLKNRTEHGWVNRPSSRLSCPKSSPLGHPSGS